MTHYDTHLFWKRQDWSQTDAVIADLTGYTVPNVARWRRKLNAPATSKAHRKHIRRKPLKMQSYADLDWKLQDVVLARMVGLSKEYIRILRLKLGKPRSPFHGQRPAAANL